MSELMNANGYVLDNNKELRVSRMVTHNKETQKKNKLQEKENMKNKNQDQEKNENSMREMAMKVDGCGANKRKGEAAENRKMILRSKREIDKEALLIAEKEQTSGVREVELDLVEDSMEDTRINRRKSKTSLFAIIAKELLKALTNSKKKAGVLNK